MLNTEKPKLTFQKIPFDECRRLEIGKDYTPIEQHPGRDFWEGQWGDRGPITHKILEEHIKTRVKQCI